MKYSVIIPAKNEEKNLPLLLEELKTVLSEFSGPGEIIVVDDGSTDDTFKNLKADKKKIKNLVGLRLRKSMGKSAALLAGFLESKGDILITIDADLQDDPREISRLMRKLSEGWDVVSGWRKERKDSFSKKAFSSLFNFVVSKIAGIPLHDFNCGLKVYKRHVIESVNLSGGMHRFIPVLAFWQGFKVTEVSVKHRKRRFGRTKYGFGRVIQGFLDFATIIFLNKYAKRPLRLFGIIGVAFSILGFLFGTYLAVLRFQGEKIGDRPLLILAVLLMVLGVQFFTLGLLGEMIATERKDKLPVSERI